MKKKSLLLILLMVLLAPWAANAQTRETQTFDFEDNAIPATWTNDATYPWVVTNAKNHTDGGTYSIKSSNEGVNSSSSSIEATFDFVNDGSISFYCWASCESPSSYWDYGVFYIDGTQMDRFLNVTDWVAKTYEVEMGSHTFKWTFTKDSSAQGNDDCFYVDDIVVDLGVAASCTKPTGLTATIIPGEGSKTKFEWNENGTATSWQLCLNDDEDNPITMNSNPFTYDQLTPEQTYTAKVRAYCSATDQSDWSNIVTFTPTDSYLITLNDGADLNTYVPVHGSYCDYGNRSQFIIPATDLAALQYASLDKLTFYTQNEVADTYFSGTVFEVYMTEVGYTAFANTEFVDWTTMDNVYTGSLVWSGTEWEFVLDNPYTYLGDNLLIGFQETSYTSNYTSTSWLGVSQTTNTAISQYANSSHAWTGSITYRTFLPKVTINYTPGEPPACGRPTNLAVNYESGTTAEVTWDAVQNAISYSIEINGVETPGLSTNRFDMEDLEPATKYEVRVNATCEAGTSDWTNLVSFFTDCTGVVIEAPYSCGFESNEDILCWTVINTSTANTAGISTQQAYEGDASFEFTSYSSASSYDQYLITPELDGQAIKINFMYVPYDAGDVFKVGYSTTTNDITAFKWGEEIAGDVQTWQEYNDAFPEGTKYVALWYYGNYAYYLWVDEFNIKAEDGCRIPTDFTASNISGHTVDLSWTENGEATEWVIAYMAEDDEEASYALADTNPFTLEGLNPLTLYYAMVSPYCGDVDSWSEVISWNTREACPTPDLKVTSYGTSAKVTWNGFSDSYELQYTQREPGEPDWLYYDNGEMESNVGSSSGGTWQWGVMYPADQIDGTYLTHVAYYEPGKSYFTTGEYTVSIYSGGDTEPGDLIGMQTVTAEGTGWRDIMLTTPIAIDDTQNLWIILTADATYCMTMSNQDGGVDSRWYYNGEGWVDFGTLFTTGAAYSFMINAGIETIDPESWAWTTVANAESPYAITGLTIETYYLVRVMGDCGEDGVSNWAYSYFQTKSICDVPGELEVVEAARTAELSWAGGTDEYNVRYRMATEYTTVWEDDFENGLDEWTIIAGIGAETVGSNEAWYTINPSSGLSFEAVSGTQVASSWSWNSSAYQANNWLITPQIELSGVVKYYVRTNENYPDRYEVRVSTATADTTDFTNILLQYDYAPANGEWNEVILPLDDFEGQMGYIAFRHYDNDANYLVIDDFGVYDAVTYEWTDVTASGQSTTISGLEPQTDYEWQVQGINTTCDGGLTDWSSMGHFTTTEETTVNETIELVSGFNWITICVDITLQELEDAIVAALPGVSGIQIISQNDGFTTYNGRMWRGGLTSIDITKMYRIKLPDGTMCEIVLTGMPVDPAANPLTISPGINWIVFPLNSSMSVADAFAGYNAISGDKLSSQDGYTTFNGRMWRGGLTTLEPGHGYIYNSKATTDQPLVYPTGSKKAAAAPVQSQMTTTGPVTLKKSVRSNQMNIVDLGIMVPASNRFSQVFNKDSRPIKLNVDIKKK